MNRRSALTSGSDPGRTQPISHVCNPENKTVKPDGTRPSAEEATAAPPMDHRPISPHSPPDHEGRPFRPANARRATREVRPRPRTPVRNAGPEAKPRPMDSPSRALRGQDGWA